MKISKDNHSFIEIGGNCMKVIIAAAGTGGHINPGIAIANKIKQEDKELIDIELANLKQYLLNYKNINN